MPRASNQYEIGDRLWENGFRRDDKWNAGRIVAICESPDRPNNIYMLLRANDGTETIYTCLKNMTCNPSLPRFMPRGMVARLGELAAGVVLVPDGFDERPKPKEPKPVVAPKKALELPDEDLSDLDIDVDSGVGESEQSEAEVGKTMFYSESTVAAVPDRILPVIDLVGFAQQ